MTASVKYRRSTAAPLGLTLTGRGGIAVVFGGALTGQLIGLAGLGPVPGILFALACAAAALLTRRGDQLTLVVTPPVGYFLAVLIAQFLSALSHPQLLQATLAGLLLGLASGAPWLFVGTLLAVALCYGRDLRGGVAELRAVGAGGGSLLRRAQHGLRKPEPVDSFDEDPVRWDVQA